MKKSLLLLLALVLASTTLSVSASAQDAKRATTVNWLQYRRDNQRSGSNPYETLITPTNANIRLTKIIGMTFDGPTPPVINQGILYTVGVSFKEPGVDEPTSVTTVYAMDAITGNIKWTYDIGCYPSSGVPAISVTARILIVPTDVFCRSQTGSGRFVALDLTTGQLKWQRGPNHSGTPAVVDATVFVAQADPFTADIVSINGFTGAVNWTTNDSSGVGFGNPTVASGVVYSTEDIGDGSHLTALNANTGARLWTTAGSAYGDPTVVGSRIIVSCDQGLCAYDTAGQFKWSHAGANGQIAASGAQIAAPSGKVYTGCDVTDVCALNATTGALLWRHEANVEIGEVQVSSATVAGSLVYVHEGPWVVLLNASTGTYVPSSPAAFGLGALEGNDAPVVVNGRVYLVSENRIYIFTQRT